MTHLKCILKLQKRKGGAKSPVKVKNMEDNFMEVYGDFISDIAFVSWYNGYDDIIKDILKDANEYVLNDRDSYMYDYFDKIQDHHSEEYIVTQILWMMFVQHFGNYGTSPRFGWIENEKFDNFKRVLNEIIKENSIGVD